VCEVIIRNPCLGTLIPCIGARARKLDTDLGSTCGLCARPLSAMNRIQEPIRADRRRQSGRFCCEAVSRCAPDSRGCTCPVQRKALARRRHPVAVFDLGIRMCLEVPTLGRYIEDNPRYPEAPGGIHRARLDFERMSSSHEETVSEVRAASVSGSTTSLVSAPPANTPSSSGEITLCSRYMYRA
jgi:hypothetical protein